jgi:hypothetical protein
MSPGVTSPFTEPAARGSRLHQHHARTVLRYLGTADPRASPLEGTPSLTLSHEGTAASALFRSEPLAGTQPRACAGREAASGQPHIALALSGVSDYVIPCDGAFR